MTLSRAHTSDARWILRDYLGNIVSTHTTYSAANTAFERRYRTTH